MNEDQEKLAWTWRQFCLRMKKAGWNNIGHGTFIHDETRAYFDGWTYLTKWNCERWYLYAQLQALPRAEEYPSYP